MGASLGGPIIKERTFFFLLYQYDPIRPEASPGGTVRIPTQSGFRRSLAFRSGPVSPPPAASPSSTGCRS